MQEKYIHFSSIKLFFFCPVKQVHEKKNLFKTREIDAFGGVSLALREWEVSKLIFFKIPGHGESVDVLRFEIHKEMEVFGRTDGQKNRQTNRRTDGKVHKFRSVIDVRMDGRTKKQTDKQTDRQSFALVYRFRKKYFT